MEMRLRVITYQLSCAQMCNWALTSESYGAILCFGPFFLTHTASYLYLFIYFILFLFFFKFGLFF